jgi:hypothetical protein
MKNAGNIKKYTCAVTFACTYLRESHYLRAKLVVMWLVCRFGQAEGASVLSSRHIKFDAGFKKRRGSVVGIGD